MPVFKRLDHVSIGVHDIDKARLFIENVLGGVPLRDAGTNPLESFSWATFQLGGKKVEIVSATTPGEGGVGRFLAKRGEGYHHLSISVEDIDAAKAHFEGKGVRVLSYNTDNPMWKHFYLHPQDTFGALIQVFEENEETLSNAGQPQE